SIVNTLLEQGGVIPLSGAERELRRIESGIPGPDGELHEAYTPLEVGLHDLVSGTKGCYTGQEVLARQVTYDKVMKHMVGVRLSGETTVGAELTLEGRTVGLLTSSTVSPRLGPVGLAVVGRAAAEPGTVLGFADRNGSAAVCSLPF
ncbi:MAG: glycine cleavage system protein T, partial [Anaerolineae bacterium]|nr:glycine cleavage system protein T [Anaerolineae bacterium]